MTAFPDMCVVMDELLVHGDRIKYRWTLSGTNTGPGGAGHQVRISGFELWQIAAEGPIPSSQGEFKAAEYRRKLKKGVKQEKIKRRSPPPATENLLLRFR